jgi:type VI secretion system protein ImpM
MGNFAPAITGLFGKIPSRGDFVRAGLPEDFVAPWDYWCREMMAASRAELGEDWLDAWLEAPIWRFLLPPGACGANAVLGVWLPGMDKVGRHFPLALCALAPSVIDLDYGAAWLDAAEEAGLAGVLDDVPHETLAERLLAPVPDLITPESGAALWWTQGSPRVQPTQHAISGLLPTSLAGAMLRDAAIPELGPT